MIRRSAAAIASLALLSACTATAAGTVTPGASASPGATASTAPGASPAAGASTAPGASAAPAAATEGVQLWIADAPAKVYAGHQLQLSGTGARITKGNGTLADGEWGGTIDVSFKAGVTAPGTTADIESVSVRFNQGTADPNNVKEFTWVGDDKGGPIKAELQAAPGKIYAGTIECYGMPKNATSASELFKAKFTFAFAQKSN